MSIIKTTNDIYVIIDDFILQRLEQPTPAFRNLWISDGVVNDITYDQFEVAELKFIDALQTNPKKACHSIIDLMPDRPIMNEATCTMPWYIVDIDTIVMPDWYIDWQSAYASCFHELIHATGHQKRLGRGILMMQVVSGSEMYAIEELIAAIGALYLQACGGIVSKYFDNSIAYLKYWLEKVEEKELKLAEALQQAKIASDFILQNNPIKEKFVAL